MNWRLALAAACVAAMVKDPNGWFATSALCLTWAALLVPPPENTLTEKETIQ